MNKEECLLKLTNEKPNIYIGKEVPTKKDICVILALRFKSQYIWLNFLEKAIICAEMVRRNQGKHQQCKVCNINQENSYKHIYLLTKGPMERFNLFKFKIPVTNL